MNRDCNGDIFIADGERYYRCLLDGEVIPEPAGVVCPNCERTIDAVFVGDLKVKTAKYVEIPDIGRVYLP